MERFRKKISEYGKSRWFIVLGIIIIAIPAIFTLLRPGFFPMYDDMQVVRLWQMDKCIKDFQIPCRWVPDLGLGYGYPLFIYYAPLPYYIMELVHLVGFSFIDSVKIGFILSVTLSGLFFYLFARNFFDRLISFFVSFLYIYAPYRAAAIFVRGAMGETWGLAMVPFLFWGFENYLSRKTLKSGLLFSVSIFVFLISHNLTVLMFSVVFLAWIVLRIYMTRVDTNYIKRIIGYSLLGLGLSAFYLVPIIFERNLVHLETLTSGYFGYLQHFISLKQLFFSLKWGYGPSILDSSDEAFLGIGPIHSLLSLLAFVLVVFKSSKDRSAKLITSFLFLVFLISAFLAHQRSTFIWKALDFLEIIQFPWRFVMVSIFVTAFLTGFFLKVLPKGAVLFVECFVILIILLTYGIFFTPKSWVYITDKEKLSGEELKEGLSASIYDYLPKVAKRAPDEAAGNSLIVIDGVLRTIERNKGSNWFDYKVVVGRGGAHVAIPAYSFPSWQVLVNNSSVTTKPYGDFGLVSFNLSEGENLIRAKLKQSIYRKLGDSLTLASFLIFIYLVGYEKYFKKAFGK